MLTNGIDATTTFVDNELARISIPAEVFSEAQDVRVASFFYRNMSGFLPESLDEEDAYDSNGLVGLVVKSPSCTDWMQIVVAIVA